MNKKLLTTLTTVALIGMSFVFLLSSAVTVLFLCGIIKNESVPYLCFAVSMLINTVVIIANCYVSKEDMRENITNGKGFAAFLISVSIIWFVSFLLFIFLK